MQRMIFLHIYGSLFTGLLSDIKFTLSKKADALNLFDPVQNIIYKNKVNLYA